jgi:hypothetical protein
VRQRNRNWRGHSVAPEQNLETKRNRKEQAEGLVWEGSLVKGRHWQSLVERHNWQSLMEGRHWESLVEGHN